MKHSIMMLNKYHFMCINYFYFDFNEDVKGEKKNNNQRKRNTSRNGDNDHKTPSFQAQTMILISINS